MNEINTKSLKNYCYDIAMDVVYQGKRKQIVDVSRANQAITFWSPNNVRRLFISPDGLAVQFYTRTCGKKLLELRAFKNIELNKVAQCFSMEDYVPMLKVLTGERMCSSIEEIVICTGSKYNLRLPSKESNLSVLNRGGQIQNSFRRLRGILIINSDLLTLLNSIGVQNLQNSLYQISDDSKLSSLVVSRVDVLKDDWWKGSYLRPARYTLDAEGKPLANYFNKVVEDMESVIKSSKLNRILDKELGDVKNKIGTNIGLIRDITKTMSMLKTVLQEKNLYLIYKDIFTEDIVNVFVSDIRGRGLKCSESALKLKELKNIREFLQHIVTVTESKSLKEDYKELNEVLRITASEGYITIVKYCLDHINAAIGVNKVVTVHKLKDIQKDVVIPPQMKSIYAELVNEIGVTPSRSIESSCITLLTMMCKLFTSEDKLSKDNYNRSYWEGKIREKGVTK